MDLDWRNAHENIVETISHISLRAQRFNQDLTKGSLLIEMGAAGNTHAEALRAADQLAKAIIALSKGTQSE